RAGDRDEPDFEVFLLERAGPVLSERPGHAHREDRRERGARRRGAHALDELAAALGTAEDRVLDGAVHPRLDRHWGPRNGPPIPPALVTPRRSRGAPRNTSVCGRLHRFLPKTEMAPVVGAPLSRSVSRDVDGASARQLSKPHA